LNEFIEEGDPEKEGKEKKQKPKPKRII